MHVGTTDSRVVMAKHVGQSSDGPHVCGISGAPVYARSGESFGQSMQCDFLFGRVAVPNLAMVETLRFRCLKERRFVSLGYTRHLVNHLPVIAPVSVDVRLEKRARGAAIFQPPVLTGRSESRPE